MKTKGILLFILMLLSSQAFAWGKRGHESVASLAAQLLAKENPKNRILLSHSYDLGYYANVPDFIWKNLSEDVRNRERYQHYIDLELFDKEFKSRGEKTGVEAPWISDRVKFFAKYPGIPDNAGRAPWRIQELADKLTEITKKLRNRNLPTNERQPLQAQWLLHAGVLGHYIGDLGMPLHVSEDYDAKKAGQGGLHSWFEDLMVDENYPHLATEVFAQAKSQWKDFQKFNRKKTPFVLAIELGANSQKVLPEMLRIDKVTGRKDIDKAAAAYKKMIVERLAASVLRLALIWSNQLDWSYNGERFYYWMGTPEFIEPVQDKTEIKK
jgi:hypothetical protein